MSPSIWDRYKHLVLEGFVLVNLAFLSLDIWLAHSINRFAHPAEWVPFFFSIFAALALAPGFAAEVRRQRRGPAEPFAGGAARLVGMLVGGGAVVVGVAGMVYHLESQFFVRFTLSSLVYTAPFVAPLAYAGLGLLLLANRMVAKDSPEWGRWVVVMGLGGFVGNFVLSVADHAQNGFFYSSEWIPVAGSALAVGFLWQAVGRQTGAFHRVCLGVLALQAVVGVAGLALHLSGSINGVSSSAYENFIHGAPVLAPLLFTNLALLGAIGVFDRLRFASSEAGAVEGRTAASSAADETGLARGA